MTNRQKSNPKPKLIIVEDDGWFAESLVGVLDDFDSRIVRNPDSAFAMIDEFQPDVILGDVILGSKNIFTLLNEMQSYTDTRQIPIVLLTGAAKQIDPKDVVIYQVQRILNKAETNPREVSEALFNTIEFGSRRGK